MQIVDVISLSVNPSDSILSDVESDSVVRLEKNREGPGCMQDIWWMKNANSWDILE